MKINTSAFHVRVYQYIFGEYLPKSLCPYFWKMILAFILAVPITLISLPIFIITLCSDFRPFDVYYDKGINGIYNFYFALICYIVIMILCIIGIVEYDFFKWLFGSVHINEHKGAAGGLVLNVFLLTLGLISLINMIRLNVKNKQNSSHKTNTQENVLIAFIKAKYNKYCPKIEWINNKEK